MQKIDKLKIRLQEAQQEIAIQQLLMSYGHFSPLNWIEAHRVQAQAEKALDIHIKNKTPFYRLLQLRKEYLEIQLAGATKALEIQQQIKAKYGLSYVIVKKNLSREILSIRKKLVF